MVHKEQKIDEEVDVARKGGEKEDAGQDADDASSLRDGISLSG